MPLCADGTTTFPNVDAWKDDTGAVGKGFEAVSTVTKTFLWGHIYFVGL